jgi:hypothetical protein
MPRPISKPHATWKPKLNEEERESTWAEAAGDDKSPGQHKDARKLFTRDANEAAVEAKNGVGLTKEDDTVLKKRQDRLSYDKARNGVRRANADYRAKQYASQNATNKTKADALQAVRAADSEAKGVGVTTEFGLGDVSRGDELECGAYNIMNNPAGVLHPKGEATTTNWIQDHGSKSIEEVLMSGEWAAYFLITKQKIIRNYGIHG